MKSFTNRLAILAVGAVVLGTMAYGQTAMNAQVPFAFHTANATLPAGNYAVNRLTTATNTMQIYNTQTRRSVFVGSLPVDWYGAVAKPVMVFACAEQDCTLREIKTGNGSYSYPAAHKPARGRDAISMIEIPLTRRNGD